MYTRYKSTGISFNEVKSNNFFFPCIFPPLSKEIFKKDRKEEGY